MKCRVRVVLRVKGKLLKRDRWRSYLHYNNYNPFHSICVSESLKEGSVSVGDQARGEGAGAGVSIFHEPGCWVLKILDILLTLQCRTMQCSAVQCSACSSVQCSAVQ